MNKKACFFSSKKSALQTSNSKCTCNCQWTNDCTPINYSQMFNYKLFNRFDEKKTKFKIIEINTDMIILFDSFLHTFKLFVCLLFWVENCKRIECFEMSKYKTKRKSFHFPVIVIHITHTHKKKGVITLIKRRNKTKRIDLMITVQKFCPKLLRINTGEEKNHFIFFLIFNFENNKRKKTGPNHFQFDTQFSSQLSLVITHLEYCEYWKQKRKKKNVFKCKSNNYHL